MTKLALPALVLTGLIGVSALSPIVYGQVIAPGAAPAAQGPATPQRQRPLPGARIEARLAYIKTALKITPAQEPQWNALADVLRRQASERDADIQQRRAARQSQAAQPQPTTAIERLERQQEMLTKAAARMNDIVTAAKPLYATFTDDQKKTADEMLDHGGRHFGHGRWH